MAYQGTNKVKHVQLQTLKIEFENLKMKDYKTTNQFMERVMELVNQLRIHREYLTNQKAMKQVKNPS